MGCLKVKSKGTLNRHFAVAEETVIENFTEFVFPEFIIDFGNSLYLFVRDVIPLIAKTFPHLFKKHNSIDNLYLPLALRSLAV